MTDIEKADKFLEEIAKHPDELFPTFSEEMAEKARQELRKAFSEIKQAKDNPETK